MSLDEIIAFLNANLGPNGAKVSLAVAVVVIAVAVWEALRQKRKVALDKDEWRPFELIDVLQLTHDVKRYRFALQSSEHVLGLPIGQHVSLKYTGDDGNPVIRSYTPTSSDRDRGHVDICLKVYSPLPPRFPEGGKMSQYVDKLRIGDKILMRGPKGSFEYKGRGKFTIRGVEHFARHIAMIAGGTGLSPMLQLIRAILDDPEDQTVVHLIFANQTEEDIFLRAELEALPKKRFNLWYTLDRPKKNWKYSAGFINTEMCREHLPAPAPDVFYLMCGPPPMIKFAIDPAFQELGISKEQTFAF